MPANRPARRRVRGSAAVPTTLLIFLGVLVAPAAHAASGSPPAHSNRASRSVVIHRSARPANVAPHTVTAQFVGLNLLNGWTAVDAFDNPPRATLTDGVVYLAGAVTGGTSSAMFVLPAQFWPPATISVSVTLCNGQRGQLVVGASGNTFVEDDPTDAKCSTALDGVSYVIGSTTALTPQNGWVTAPGYADPGYMIERGVVVHLRGQLQSGSNSTLLTLPPAIRPSADVYVNTVLCNGVVGRLHISPSGAVSVETLDPLSTAQCGTALNGVSWLMSASAGLSLQNGWVAGPFVTRIPGVQVVSGIVHLQGAAAAGSTGAMFTLPGGARPNTNLVVPVDLCNAHRGRLAIQPQYSGQVTVSTLDGFSNAMCFTSLEGVSFAVPTITWSPLTLTNGWQRKQGANAPMWGYDRRRIYFRGAITTSGSNPVPFTLPLNARPLFDTYLNVDVCNGHFGRLWIANTGVVTVQATRGFSDAACGTSLEGASLNNSGFLGFDMINGWVSGPYRTWSAGIDAEAGIATLVGGIFGGVVSTNPFVIPEQYRPKTNVTVPVSFCNDAKGRLWIGTDGTVTIQAFGGNMTNAHCFTALDNVSYAIQQGSTLLAYQNGWFLSPGFAPATAENVEGVVHLSGAIATHGSNPVAFTLPPALRPAVPVSVPVDVCGAAYGRLLIGPDGKVNVQGENSFADAACYTSLEGAQYSLTDTDRFVSTSWSAAEVGRLGAMGQYLGRIGPSQVPKAATYMINFLIGSNHTPTPMTPPTQAAGTTFTDTWQPNEVAVLDAVKAKYVLNDSNAEYVATKVVDYLLALGGH